MARFVRKCMLSLGLISLGWLGLDEGGKGLALAVLDALLVDREGDVGEDRGDDVAGVLEARRHVVLGGFGGEELYVRDGVCFGEAEAVVVLLLSVLVGFALDTEKGVTYIAVHIIRVDSITTLLRSKLNTLLHNIAHILTPQVEPLLIRPSVKRLAQVGLLKLVLVVAPVFPRPGAKVTDDLLSGLSKCRKCFCVVVIEVKVVDAHVGLQVVGGAVVVELDGLEEDDLPRGADLGLPYFATGLEGTVMIVAGVRV